MTVRIINGDSRSVLRTLADRSAHICISSPPYYGLRDYGVDGQIGLEPSPAEFIEEMVMLFREVRRVLRDDGSLWLNLGDTYASKPNGPVGAGGHKSATPHVAARTANARRSSSIPAGFKHKDLMGIPWRVAFALQDDGWYLRQDIIWHKPNPMPESVTDRCTKSHEYLFLLTKSARYFYDADAVREAVTGNANARKAGKNSGENVDRTPLTRKIAKPHSGVKNNTSNSMMLGDLVTTRNKRSVWSVASEAFPEAHFATFPPALIEPCVQAGTSAKGCCVTCGTGWRRVTISRTTYESNSGISGIDIFGKGHVSDQIRVDHDIRKGPTKSFSTIGWYPDCSCLGLPPLPAYPVKAIRAGSVASVEAEDAERLWLDACASVDDSRRQLCAAVANARTTPAVVLDPFSGAGTTGLVADRLQRDAVLIELNPEYVKMAARRISARAPMLTVVQVEEMPA